MFYKLYCDLEYVKYPKKAPDEKKKMVHQLWPITALPAWEYEYVLEVVRIASREDRFDFYITTYEAFLNKSSASINIIASISWFELTKRSLHISEGNIWKRFKS